MDAFFSFLKVLVIGVVVVLVVFMILMALPKSKLRNLVVEYLGWGTTAVSAVSVVSPVDMIPDLIPVLGQTDDIGMLVTGLGSAFLAYQMRRQRKKLESEPSG